MIPGRAVRIAAVLMTSAASTPALAAPLFEKLAGSWSGTGTVALLGGGPERLRCRASYAPSGSTRLHLSLACASDSLKMQVASDVTRDGDALSGSWREESFGITGQITGRIRGDRVDATVAGMGITARLSIVLRGQAMSVTLASQGQMSGTAAVTLRRN